MIDCALTLKDFSEQILKPSVLHAIKSGRMDDVLLDPDVLDSIKDDPEMLAAICERIPALKEKFGD